MQAEFNKIITLLNSAQFDQVILQCQSLIQHVNHPQLHLFMAIALGESGELERAKEIFENLKKHFPTNPDIHYNYGLILQKSDSLHDAIGSYENCIRLVPQHASAWNNLGETYIAKLQYKRAIKCFQKCCQIQPQNISYIRNLAKSQYLNNDFDDALQIYKQLILQLGVNDSDDFYAAIDCCIALRQLKMATNLCQKALGAHPDNTELLNLSGLNELEKRKFNSAIPLLKKSLRLKPNQPETLCHLASAHSYLGQQSNCYEILDQLMEFRQEACCVFVCMMYESSNQDEKLSSALEVSTRLFPENPELKLIHAKSMRKQKKYNDAVQLNQSILLDDNLCDKDQILPSLHFELAQNYDKIEQYDLAWTEFNTANQSNMNRWNSMTHRADTFHNDCALMQSSLETLDSKFQSNSCSLDGENLIFLVGFPRSGTTLLDSILSSHSDVTVLEEAPILGEVFDSLNVGSFEKYGISLENMTESDIQTLQKLYYDLLPEYSDWNHQGVLLDKSPLNTLHVAFIHRVFPQAKIIFALRHPMDVCLSCFFQDFKMNQFMTHLTDIDEAARTYDSMLKLWNTAVDKLEIPVIYLKYESLVNQPETELKNLIKKLDLDWQPQLLQHHKSLNQRGTITTPSYNQVNQPIYKTAKNRYKNYEKHLVTAMKVLKPWLHKFQYDSKNQ